MTETITYYSGRETAYHLTVGQPTVLSVSSTERAVAQQATEVEEVDQLRAALTRCQSLAVWLARHSDLGVDVEADGIRRAIGDRLRAALGSPTQAPEWERHGLPGSRCAACDRPAALALARVAEAVEAESNPEGGPIGEYDIGWNTAMDLIRAALKEQP
ncbi:hypothetical protein [Streptomyces sp. NPDC060322]|uniref:hypothetical protein n=1 Tax=Streptomyces sp. NPDC060322 TaxID=3347097 RepID=UPI0036655ABA